MPFDANKAYEYTKAISIPRRVGSPGEREAADYIVNKLRQFGLEVREEGFSFPTSLGLFLKTAIFCLLLLLSVMFFLFPLRPLHTGLVALLTLILLGRFITGAALVASLRFCLFKKAPFLTRRQGSKNIIATFKEEADKEGTRAPGPHLFIMAHYDSKSQSIPLVFRIVLTGLLLCGTVTILCNYLIGVVTGASSLGGWLYVAYSLTNFAGFLLLLTGSGNCSPGAIDNASGVGVLLHLAEVLSKEGLKGSRVQGSKLKGLEVTFVATGAEEEGLIGGFYLCNFLKEDMPRENSYFINLDGVGLKGRIYCTDKMGLHFSSQRQRAFLSLIKRAADEEGLRVSSPPLVIGGMADHFCFVSEGFNAVTLSTVSRKSLVVHTQGDSADKIDLEALEGVGRLLLRVIGRLKGEPPK